MSNTPKSVIIQEAKLNRIDVDHANLDITTMALDAENDALPGTEFAILVNSVSIGSILANPDGIAQYSEKHRISEGATVSIQIQEIASGTKSKVKILMDTGKSEKIEEPKKADVPKKEKPEQPKENIPTKTPLEQLLDTVLTEIRQNPSCFSEPRFNAHRGRKTIAQEAVMLDPFNYQYVSEDLKEDGDIIDSALNGNFETIVFMGKDIILRDDVLSRLKKMPRLFTMCIASFLKSRLQEDRFRVLNRLSSTGDINSCFYENYSCLGGLLYGVESINLVLLHIDLFQAHPQMDFDGLMGYSDQTTRVFLKSKGILV